ncbi:MAG: hypothetical protein EAZ91_22225 [Cytophagales bacterium]|nr:MAG: hypothetical protein EAZ91_22225 [Cytophagales bacterium]
MTDNKLKNDPTYSIHNYKHPNKALAARAWESEIVLGRRGNERRRVTVGDYKRTAQAEPGRSVIVLSGRRRQPTNPEVLAGHNYKNPRPTSVARKESRRQAKPIVIVPAEDTPTGND